MERATAADATFRPTGRDIPAIADLCDVLGGLPLAIELAAARVATMPPTSLLSALREGSGLDLLRTGPESDQRPQRHRSMQRALAWTIDLLAAPARELLYRLSAFRGSFSLAGVIAVAGEASDARGDVYDLLSLLVDTHLVEFEGGYDEARFRLPPLVRLYACDQLVALDERSRVEESHSRFVIALGRQAGKRFEAGDQPGAFTLGWKPNGPKLLLCSTASPTTIGAQTGCGSQSTVRRSCLPWVTTRRPGVASNGSSSRCVADAMSTRPFLARALVWSVLLARQSANPQAHQMWACDRLAGGIALARASNDDRTVMLGLESTAMSFPVTRDPAGTANALTEGIALATEIGDEWALSRLEALSSMLAQQRGDLDVGAELVARAMNRALRHDESEGFGLRPMCGIVGNPLEEEVTKRLDEVTDDVGDRKPSADNRTRR